MWKNNQFEIITVICYITGMSYKCCFPGCPYETASRPLIEFHHTHLREAGNRLGKGVTIPLCPTHHKLIYHPEATSGQHAEKFEESMMVKAVTNSTKGMCVIFEDMKGNEHISYLDEIPEESFSFMMWDILHGIVTGVTQSLDEGILDRVERDGYFASGATVYYVDGKEAKAKELLANHVAEYMKKAKSEFDSALEKARNDWKLLKQGLGTVPVVSGQ